MGERNSPTDTSTPLMRFALGFVTGATALCTAGPVVLVLGTILAFGLFAAAAYSLDHTDALEIGSFAAANGYGAAGLIAFFMAALGYRVARRGAKGILGAVSRWPIVTAVVVLPVLSLVVLLEEWDNARVSSLSGALILDDLYFFSVGGVVLMAVLALFFARGVYRWAAPDRYRAGLVTGAQLTVLALLVAAIARTTPPAAQPAPTPAVAAWQARVVDAFEAASAVEAERRLLLSVDALFEPDREARFDTASAASPGDDEIRACVDGLFRSDFSKVKGSVAFRYRLPDDEVHDIVMDALLNVCIAHVRRRYTSLPAVLQTAAQRRALTWTLRRARRCDLDEARVPSCTPTPDESARFAQEDAIIDAAFCDEDALTKQVIQLWLQGFRYAEIGAKLGLTENDSRYRCNNATGRMRRRLAKDCGP